MVTTDHPTKDHPMTLRISSFQLAIQGWSFYLVVPHVGAVLLSWDDGLIIDRWQGPQAH